MTADKHQALGLAAKAKRQDIAAFMVSCSAYFMRWHSPLPLTPPPPHPTLLAVYSSYTRKLPCACA